VTGPDAEAIEGMIHLLARNVAFNLTGRGHSIAKMRIHAYPFYWAFAGAAGAGLAAGILQHAYRQQYDQYRTSDRFDDIARHYDRANLNFHARNIVLGASGAGLIAGVILWLQNGRENNFLLADGSPAASGRLVITPSFDRPRDGFTIRVTWYH
jgi:hypothetical protein